MTSDELTLQYAIEIPSTYKNREDRIRKDETVLCRIFRFCFDLSVMFIVLLSQVSKI